MTIWILTAHLEQAGHGSKSRLPSAHSIYPIGATQVARIFSLIVMSDLSTSLMLPLSGTASALSAFERDAQGEGN